MLDEKDLQAIAQLMDAKLEKQKQEIKTELRQELIQDVKVLLDTEVTSKLNLLAEGQDILKERLDTLDEVKELVEDTKSTVDVMYSVVSKHSIDIAKLKAKVG